LPTQPDNVLVLPFDLCGGYDVLEQAAAAADSAFGAAGVDYLIHNAGQASFMLAPIPRALGTSLSFLS
jgi:NAD(P)-dependent dehydrogenase (short-subunit alcohol dehydrogenase family)